MRYTDLSVRAVLPDRAYRLQSTQRPPMMRGGARSDARARFRSLWARGARGANVTVGVFDTGVYSFHLSNLPTLVEVVNWTDEEDVFGSNGHGTAMAGILGSRVESCPGLVPGSRLVLFKVFDKHQVSFTSWFLDAFNYALFYRIPLLHLSLGGPDFTDQPFRDKIVELSSEGITLVSSAGNDGPGFGTLTSPAEQWEVIAVGSTNSGYSSRGPTLESLPARDGQFKPDLVAPGDFIATLGYSGPCEEISGTSVAAPFATAAIALLMGARASPVPAAPSFWKQLLQASAVTLADSSVFHQGAGQLDVVRAFQMLPSFAPHVSLFPPSFSMRREAFFYPLSLQPLYASGPALTLTLSVLNSVSIETSLLRGPLACAGAESSVRIRLAHADFRSWGGLLSLEVLLTSNAVSSEAWLSCDVEFVFLADHRQHAVRFALTLRAVAPPPTSSRFLWDQFHQFFYPLEYIPSDDQVYSSLSVDRRGDSLFTNYVPLLRFLRSRGLFIESVRSELDVSVLSGHSVLIVADPERAYTPSELEAVHRAQTEGWLSLLVLGEWSLDRVDEFVDPLTRQRHRTRDGTVHFETLQSLVSPLTLQRNAAFYGTHFFGPHKMTFYTGTTVSWAPDSFQRCETPLYQWPSKEIHSVVLGAAGVLPSGSHLFFWGDSAPLDDEFDKFGELAFLLEEAIALLGGRPMADSLLFH